MILKDVSSVIGRIYLVSETFPLNAFRYFDIYVALPVEYLRIMPDVSVGKLVYKRIH